MRFFFFFSPPHKTKSAVHKIRACMRVRATHSCLSLFWHLLTVTDVCYTIYWCTATPASWFILHKWGQFLSHLFYIVIKQLKHICYFNFQHQSTEDWSVCVSSLWGLGLPVRIALIGHYSGLVDSVLTVWWVGYYCFIHIYVSKWHFDLSIFCKYLNSHPETSIKFLFYDHEA